MKTTTNTEAKRLGYIPVTYAYTVDEREMLGKALEDFRHVDHLLVKNMGCIAIYRKKSELGLIKRNKKGEVK